jgi:hypothetical protein
MLCTLMYYNDGFHNCKGLMERELIIIIIIIIIIIMMI